MATKAEDIYAVSTSGYVNRYHNHPSPRLRNAQDLTDAHSNRMIKLFLSIFPEMAINCANLVVYLSMHDAGEFAAGDSPHNAKKENPDLKASLDNIEGRQLDYYYESFGLDFDYQGLTDHEKKVAKLLDLMESFIFQCIHDPEQMLKEAELFYMITNRASELDKFEIVTAVLSCALRVNNARIL